MIRRVMQRREPLLELRAGRQARDHALVLDHVRAGGAAPADRLEVGRALGERDREGGAERVAGAGACRPASRRKRRDDVVAEPRALLAERDARASPSRVRDRRGLGLVRRRGSRRPARSGSRGAGAGLRMVRTPAARADRERVQRGLDAGSRAGRAGRRRRRSAARSRPRARASARRARPGRSRSGCRRSASTRIAAVIVGSGGAEHRRRVDPLLRPQLERRLRRTRPHRPRSGARPRRRAGRRRPPGSTPCRRGRGGRASRSRVSPRSGARAEPNVSPTP